LFPSPSVRTDFAALAAFPVANEDRATWLIEVRLDQR
jgi:hypothetical protein